MKWGGDYKMIIKWFQKTQNEKNIQNYNKEKSFLKMWLYKIKGLTQKMIKSKEEM